MANACESWWKPIRSSADQNKRFKWIESRNIKCNVNFICQIYSDLFVDVVAGLVSMGVFRVRHTVLPCFNAMLIKRFRRNDDVPVRSFAPLTENWENSNGDAKCHGAVVYLWWWRRQWQYDSLDNDGGWSLCYHSYSVSGDERIYVCCEIYESSVYNIYFSSFCVRFVSLYRMERTFSRRRHQICTL